MEVTKIEIIFKDKCILHNKKLMNPQNNNLTYNNTMPSKQRKKVLRNYWNQGNQITRAEAINQGFGSLTEFYNYLNEEYETIRRAARLEVRQRRLALRKLVRERTRRLQLRRRIQTAFNQIGNYNAYSSYNFDPKNQTQSTNMNYYYNRNVADFYRLIVAEKRRNPNLKINIKIHNELGTPNEEGGFDNIFMFYYTTNAYQVNNVNAAMEWLENGILNIPEIRGHAGTGVTWIRLLKLTITFAHFVAQIGGTYIELPQKIKSKNAIINIKNKDNRCLWYSLAAHYNPVEKNGNRISNYKNVKLDIGNIKYPAKIKDLAIVEKNIKANINVYTYNKQIEVLRFSENKYQEIINLFWYKNHFSYIKNWSRFTNCNGEKKKICPRCLSSFKLQKSLDSHKAFCDNFEAIKTKMPEPDTLFTFQDKGRDNRHPIALYCDFESILEKQEEQHEEDGTLKNTQKYQKHKIASYGIKIVCKRDLGIDTQHIYKGIDAGENFIDLLKEIQQTIYFKVLKDLDKEQRFIPVFFHNLKGYDAHHIFSALKKTIEEKDKLEILPLNSEKYISFSLNDYRFLDSVNFLNSSLDSLLKNLDNKDKKLIKQFTQTEERFNLLNKKGFYPYDWFDSIDKLNYNGLPEQKDFFNILTDSHINNNDYEHAKKVYNTFNCNNFADYHDLYLTTDILGLADLFEAFRTLSINTYGLDPVHYYTLPGYSMDAALKYTGAELELLSDIDKHLFIEKSIRGGVSVISKRYVKANNKYLADYDKKKEDNYLMYIDANNLYGWSMVQPLPVGNFQWEETDFNTDKPCFVEVDIEYPQELHDLHNDYPLLPSKRNIKQEEISAYSTTQLEKYKTKFYKRNTKLVADLKNKKNYIMHYRMLKLVKELGIKVTKIHKVLSFYEEAWLKSYIDLNTNLRKSAKNDFEKDFYKLMNNSVFGKTMENVRGRSNFKIATTDKQFEKWVSKPTFKRCIEYAKDLIGVESAKSQVVLDKPIYSGAAILDLSKVLMFDFHYNTIKKKYGNNATLCFTDTDSLCYDIKTKDIYEDMKDNKEEYDFSNYEKNHPLYDNTNKKVIGKMKDECGGKVMSEFVGLRSKMYSYVVGSKEEKKCKGIKKGIVAKQLRFNHYKKTIQGEVLDKVKQNSLRSFQHVLYSIEQEKVALSAYDDKRYILPNGIETLAYGHYKIS